MTAHQKTAAGEFGMRQQAVMRSRYDPDARFPRALQRFLQPRGVPGCEDAKGLRLILIP